MSEEPRIYVPEDPDELRDGLYRGFYAHQQKTPPVGGGALKKESNADVRK